MILDISGHRHQFECENLCRLFFPYSQIKSGKSQMLEASEVYLSAKYENQKFNVSIIQDGKKICDNTKSSHGSEYDLTSLVYTTLVEFTEKRPVWGMLTGIHPVKLFSQISDLKGENGAAKEFKEKYFVSDEKINLSIKVNEAQKSVVKAFCENDFALYVSIPFCPTRCVYCSFVSQSVDKSHKLIEPYLEKLTEELEKVSQITKELGLRLVSIYVGGGTPTTLSEKQLELLMETIYQKFNLTSCREITVEAGRPDTISMEKLVVLKKYGVSRISINPQSLTDKVLSQIGRLHTAQDIFKAYQLAHSVGFENINSDIIAGLPLDDAEGFKTTLTGVISLGATNITVHSLAIKRSSTLLRDEKNLIFHKNTELLRKIISESADILSGSGFIPYYLYRQTHTAGNLENTGWAKPNKICEYNIYTMDETGTVIACGAGGVSKLRDPYSARLERIFNFKYPYEYISRFDEMLDRKNEVRGYYEQFRKRIY